MRIAPIFQDGLVLQKDKPLYVYGTGIGNIKVKFQGKEFETNSIFAKWEVCLGRFPAGGPFALEITLTTNHETETKILKDVYVGTVLLIAGQSNVQWTVADATQFGLSYDIDENPLIRTFVTTRLEEHPHIDAKDGWVKLSKDMCQHFSALGLHLAEYIHKDRNEAVGFVGCWQGASNIQTWLPKEICERADIYVDEIFQNRNALELYYDWNISGLCYEHQFKTLVPFAFDSAIWYQGCSNTSDGTERKYGLLLRELITRWRYDLRQPLHFTVIELANLEPCCDTWHLVQEAQSNMPNILDGVTAIECKDISETNTIHPVDKRPLAKRIFETVYKK
jgi:hypothetical protein